MQPGLRSWIQTLSGVWKWVESQDEDKCCSALSVAAGDLRQVEAKMAQDFEARHQDHFWSWSTLFLESKEWKSRNSLYIANT